MSTCLIAGALAPNSFNTQTSNSYYDSVQREFSQVVLNHLLALNTTLTVHKVNFTSAVFIEGFNATFINLGLKESVLIIEQHSNNNEFYLVTKNYVADKLNLNHQYQFSNQSALSVDAETGTLKIKHYTSLLMKTHFMFDGETTALSVKTPNHQFEEHNRLTASHTVCFSNQPGHTASQAMQFSHYLNTVEGRQISHWDMLPLNESSNSHEQALFVARTKYNRLEGELELFEAFMRTRHSLRTGKQAQYDDKLIRIHHQVQNAFWSLEHGDFIDPSLQAMIAIALLEKFYTTPAQIDALLSNVDICWQLISRINMHEFSETKLLKWQFATTYY
jgi:hypothetical protein